EGNFVYGIIAALEGARGATRDWRWRRGSCRDNEWGHDTRLVRACGGYGGPECQNVPPHTPHPRENPPISAFLTFAYSHIQLLPLSQLHDHAFKPSGFCIK